MAGASTTTDTKKANQAGQCSFRVRMLKTRAEVYAWAANAKLKTPVPWYVRMRPMANSA